MLKSVITSGNWIDLALTVEIGIHLLHKSKKIATWGGGVDGGCEGGVVDGGYDRGVVDGGCDRGLDDDGCDRGLRRRRSRCRRERDPTKGLFLFLFFRLFLWEV